MENRTHAIIAICFLVVFSVAAVVIFLWLSSGPGEPLAYRIVTSQSVAGLEPQSTVEFKGLTVGHVTRIRFDPHNPAKVVVDFHVRRGTYITHATYGVLAKHGLTGGEVLELKLGEGSRKLLQTSADHPAHIPLRKSYLGQLEASAKQIMDNLKSVLASANKLLDTDNRQHISATLKHLDAVTAKLVTIENQLMPTLQRMPELMRSLQQNLKTSQQLLTNANQLAKAAHGPVNKLGKVEDNVRQLTHKLNTQTAPDISELSRSLMRTSRQLQTLIDQLNAKPQSLIFGPSPPPPGPGEPGFEPHGGQGDKP
ncbi:MAG TPA: MlaD family protein [Oleiagrimonas sp.]|nr:MlaD family protein [Oleiagrimonas sp.]